MSVSGRLGRQGGLIARALLVAAQEAHCPDLLDERRLSNHAASTSNAALARLCFHQQRQAASHSTLTPLRRWQGLNAAQCCSSGSLVHDHAMRAGQMPSAAVGCGSAGCLPGLLSSAVGYRHKATSAHATLAKSSNLDDLKPSISGTHGALVLDGKKVCCIAVPLYLVYIQFHVPADCNHFCTCFKLATASARHVTSLRLAGRLMVCSHPNP